MSGYGSALRRMGARVEYEFSFEHRSLAFGEVPQ